MLSTSQTAVALGINSVLAIRKILLVRPRSRAGGGLEPPKWEIRGLYNRSLAVSQCFWKRGRSDGFGSRQARSDGWAASDISQGDPHFWAGRASAARAPGIARQLHWPQKDKTRWKVQRARNRKRGTSATALLLNMSPALRPDHA
ncbi:hypothetical protein MesoLj131c_13800 [Mesorhizobium sp. 131-3-5]|nr:hypothetical protein MesoLj131c_13800 [Mesorhizobium sp. 131-3-5]